jgi:hypothetical protein
MYKKLCLILTSCCKSIIKMAEQNPAPGLDSNNNKFMSSSSLYSGYLFSNTQYSVRKRDPYGIILKLEKLD